MGVETYRKKRDFKVTSEPRGARSRKAGHSFVVQKHDASHLHYDFRLEMDGVLKSWAVPKGPSLVSGEKRLAVHVEDHPLEYGDFEGTIPKGQYGGGSVIVWDRGAWAPIGDPHKGYAKGHLDFELSGEKLRGRWHLARMHGKPGEKRENWLLIKGDDEFSRDDSAPDILDEQPASAKTGRDIADIGEDAPKWSTSERAKHKPKKPGANPSFAKLKGAKATALPDFVEPMLATLVDAPPGGERWLHEIKFDGYRLQARVSPAGVKLMTRSGLDWTHKFGDAVVAALRALSVREALIDGELVVEAGAGASDFSALQADLSDGRNDRFVFYAFDLLYLDGHDLRALPLIRRKELLQSIVSGADGIVRYSGEFDGGGDLVLRHACRLSLEGIVSKVRDAPYQSGRSKGWLKSKCSARQEFVVAGYAPSSALRNAIGSLILGVYEDKALIPVGRVGTGFSQSIAQDLYRQLEGKRLRSSPFATPLNAEDARQARYVKPELVAEVEFRGWTADSRLRHASFRGLREDKPAAEIMRETSSSTPVKTQRRTVKLTHPDRLYWPDVGVTKEGLVDYYSEVWRFMAPFVVGRALALLRGPDGVTGQHFFQKHIWRGINAKIALIPDPKAPSEPPLVGVNDLDGLLWLVQSGVLEIHPWGSTIRDWERPDTLIMDLDPGEDAPWPKVISAAEEIRGRLRDAGLAAFVKTSGGKGLHVVSPLKPKADWAEVKAFSKGIADAMSADSPDSFVATITKAQRRGKIFIDYLRNQRGATAVAAYSTRARPGAAVSMPLAWDELNVGIGPAYFTVMNTPTRLAALKKDPWDGFRQAAAPVETAKRRRKPAK